MPRLIVTYRGSPEWPSEQRFDERLEKLLGKPCAGSGCGLGGRDIDWTYRSYAGANAAALKVQRYIMKEKRPVYRNATVTVGA